jgi:hypothetical protein
MIRKSSVSNHQRPRPDQSRKALFRAVKGGLLVFLTGTFVALAGTPTNLQEALQAQRAQVAANPGDGDLLNDLGNLLALAGNFAEAEEVYRRALEVEPTDVTSLYNLALVLQEQDDTKQATKVFRSILELDPRHAWTHYQLGTIYAQQKNRAKAVRHYSEAFSADRSLTSPEVNPHIVENRLATDALLKNHLEESPSTQAPRIYEAPGDVADLLLQQEPTEPTTEPTPVTEPAPDGEPISRQPRSSASSAAASIEPTSSVAVSPSKDLPPTTSSPEDTVSESESKQTSTRRIDDTTLRTRQTGQTGPTGDSGQDLGSTTIGTTPSPGTRSDSSPASGVAGSPTSSLVSPAEPTQADTVEPSEAFTPGLSSTGRLEIELLPAEEGTLVVRSS